MADVKKLVSLENLTSYDSLIKTYLKNADDVIDAKSIKTVLLDGDVIKFYKKENAQKTDTPDYTVTISSSDVTALKTRVGMDSTLTAYQSKDNVTDIVNVLTGANTVDGSVAKVAKDAADGVVGTSSDTKDSATVYGAKAFATDAVSTLENGQVKTNKEAIEAINNETTGILAVAKKYTDDEIDKLDTTADVALASATDGVVTIKAVKEVDGIIEASTDTTKDVTLAKVATTGTAADVAVADASEKITATTVEGALLEIVNKADANTTAISTLNGDDATTGSVAKAIKDKVADLKNTDEAVANQFVTAVAESNGIVTVSRAALTADDIPTLTLAKISDAGTAAAATVATADIAESSTDTSLVSAAQVAKFVGTEIAGLEGAMHFVGVITRNEGETDDEAIRRVITAPESGDVVVMSDNAKEYIYVDPDPETTGDESWREVGDEGNYVQKTTTIAGIDLEDNITKDELLTALNVADGAQVNVLEGVQVNGADLTITDKKVNVTVATGATDGTVAVNGTDVAVKGLGGAAYKAEDYYEVAGTAQTKIEALDATVTTVTEADPTPVVAVSVTETDGKLTAISASIKDETFEAYGTVSTEIAKLDADVKQESSDTNPVAVEVKEVDGKLTEVTASVVTATTDDINGLFTEKTEA